MNGRFDFYEIVRIVSEKVELKQVNNYEAVVLGKSQNEITGCWGYAVSVFNDDGLVWDVLENDLVSTGKMADPRDFGYVDQVKVRNDAGDDGRIADSEK